MEILGTVIIFGLGVVSMLLLRSVLCAICQHKFACGCGKNR